MADPNATETTQLLVLAALNNLIAMLGTQATVLATTNVQLSAATAQVAAALKGLNDAQAQALKNTPYHQMP